MGFHNSRVPPGVMQKPLAQPGQPMGDMMGGGGMAPMDPFSLHNSPGGEMVGQPMPGMASGTGGYDQIRQAMGGMKAPPGAQVYSPGGLPAGGGFPPTGGGDPMSVGPGQGPATMGPTAMPTRQPPQMMPQPGPNKPMMQPQTKPQTPFAGAGPMTGQTGGGLQAQPMRRKQYDRGSTIKRADAQNGAKAKNLVASASAYKKG